MATDGRLALAAASDGERTVSLVLPAFNEQESIVRAIEEADQALRSLTQDYEIIVVDDGSVDETFSRASEAATRLSRVRIVRHEVNRGYGAAIRTGFEVSTKACLAFTDSDSQFHLHELERHLLLIRDYDIVCGYRIDRKDNWLRCLYSSGYNAMVRTLLGTGVRDVDCALKLFRRSVFTKIQPQTNGFLINAETMTLARQAGLSVVEVGVSHRPRVRGSSTVSVTHIPVVLSSTIRFWWNQVFCGERFVGGTSLALGDTSSRPMRDRLVAIAFAILAVAALLLNLRYPLIARDETRYAEIPREMIVRGDWIVPRLNFEPYFDKPPLFYWLSAMSYRVFGVSEWSVRLVPAISACCLLVMIVTFARRYLGRSSGMAAAAVLFATAGFVFCSRFLIIDMVLTLFTTASSLALFHSVATGRFRYGWWLLGATACGLGVLTKGPIALVLVVPPAIAFLWLAQPSVRPGFAAWTLWLIVSLAISVPWCLAMQSREPSFAYEFFVRHNMARFAGAFHPQPWWYYVPVILVGGHPWTFLTLPFAQFLVSRQEAVRQRRPQVFGYLALQSLWCLVFFSFSRCKLPAYVLPAAPFMAMMMGHYLATHFRQASEAFWDRIAQALAPYWALATSCLAGIAVACVVISTGFVPLTPGVIVVSLWMLGLVGVVYLYRCKIKPMTAWCLSGCVASVLFLQIMHQWLPAWAAGTALLPSSNLVLGEVRDGGNTIVTFGDELSSVPYYARRSDVQNVFDFQKLTSILSTHDRSVVIFDQLADVERTKAALAGTTEIVPIDAERGVFRFQRMATETARKFDRPVLRH